MIWCMMMNNYLRNDMLNNMTNDMENDDEWCDMMNDMLSDMMNDYEWLWYNEYFSLLIYTLHFGLVRWRYLGWNYEVWRIFTDTNGIFVYPAYLWSCIGKQGAQPNQCLAIFSREGNSIWHYNEVRGIVWMILCTGASVQRTHISYLIFSQHV